MSEITIDHRTTKNDSDMSDWDEFIDDTELVTYIKGYEIHFHRDEVQDEYLYFVKEEDQEGFLGQLVLANRKGYYHSEVFFAPEIQGQGLAVPLYAYVIKSGRTIVSDKTQTPGSKALWAKLAKVPGINVYGWRPGADNEYFHWDPDEDLDSEIYHDANSTKRNRAKFQQQVEKLKQDKLAGKISEPEYNDAMQRATDDNKASSDEDHAPVNNGTRLVATIK